MLARLNSTPEISLLPTGLGNHYTSSSRHLIPPGRRRFPYNNNNSDFNGDPNAPEANMSFREQQEYFGPDVLVIIGLVLACLGAILTLISFYCHFKHPAIQATMAGIGPSLVGIGLLFCVLRLFFCTFFISRTCCECIGDGLRYLILRCPICKCCRKKKKVHPLQVKDIKPILNGSVSKQNGGFRERPSAIEMLPPHHRIMEPIHESEEQTTKKIFASDSKLHSDDDPPKEEEDILKDEIDLLESSSPHSENSLHKNINELVLNSRY
ncbi:uncharacterized protein [Parasteatoda tepidariorum]|uniref:uncharacterized protein n=1 Tax=Parasteatoda tepidariorum TaxID=114398 RepID=UPI00077FDD91|nr:uncharacterized protein LOC107450474 [Parasteatoda tepidariorum]